MLKMVITVNAVCWWWECGAVVIEKRGCGVVVLEVWGCGGGDGSSELAMSDKFK